MCICTSNPFPPLFLVIYCKRLGLLRLGVSIHNNNNNNIPASGFVVLLFLIDVSGFGERLFSGPMSTCSGARGVSRAGCGSKPLTGLTRLCKEEKKHKRAYINLALRRTACQTHRRSLRTPEHVRVVGKHQQLLGERQLRMSDCLWCLRACVERMCSFSVKNRLKPTLNYAQITCRLSRASCVQHIECHEVR